MKYADLHCDSITFCKDRNICLGDGDCQVNFKKLKRAGCAVQCFAIFTNDAHTADYERYLCFYGEQLKKYGDSVFPVLSSADFDAALRGDKVGCLLAVENLGFIGRDIGYLKALHKQGVRMASLVWNYENGLALPNLVFENGYPLFDRREERGLKDLGRAAVEELDRLKIIVDVSHLSDGGAREILRGRKIPAVAGHSNAAAVCGVCRNLTDELIRDIADCGGVVGVNFCYDFLGGGDAFEKVYQNVAHLINAGGEDVVAFGSDFDGIPETPALEDCEKMPALLEYLQNRLPQRVIEKLAYKNFYRVFKEVCG